MFCSECGKEIPDGSRVCPFCGEAVEVFDEDIVLGNNISDSSAKKEDSKVRDTVKCDNAISDESIHKETRLDAYETERVEKTRPKKSPVGLIVRIAIALGICGVLIALFVGGRGDDTKKTQTSDTVDNTNVAPAPALTNSDEVKTVDEQEEVGENQQVENVESIDSSLEDEGINADNTPIEDLELSEIIEVSSMSKTKNGNYGPENLVDRDRNTAWVTSTDEVMLCTYAVKPFQSIKGIAIVVGDTKNDETYREYGIPTVLEVSSDKGEDSVKVSLEKNSDSYSTAFATYYFDQPITTYDGRFIICISDYISGKDDAFVAISELYLIADESENISSVSEMELEFLDIEKVESKTTLEGGDYAPANMFDKDITTAWVMNSKFSSTVASFVLTLPKNSVVAGIKILPGYTKNQDIYEKNAVPTQFKVYTSEPNSYVYLDLDRASNTYSTDYQYYFFDEPIVVKDGKLNFSITHFISGTKYTDICISELELIKGTSDLVNTDVSESEYIVEGSDTGYFEKEFWEQLSDEELRLARNELYARHGRKFKSEDLQEYFESKSWYHGQYEPEEFDKIEESVLNDWEKYNRDMIRLVEDERKN